ncbi:hypothetical protein [Streptomyces sp. NPDC052693]|uniref:hypothetical protein n=1 Tax=Streptomyces sp. NPDC052693 TaxID=3155814 RepID=UPI0034123F61
MHDRGGGDAQGVALPAPYGRPLVERGALGWLQFGGPEVVRNLARHAEGDRQLRGRRVFLAAGVLVVSLGKGLLAVLLRGMAQQAHHARRRTR